MYLHSTVRNTVSIICFRNDNHRYRYVFLRMYELCYIGKHLSGLKGQCHEIFYFWFFHESVSPLPLSILKRSFQIFAAQGAPPVPMTQVANGKNLQAEKFKLFCMDTFG
jgi:hypothetical protein